MAVIQARDTSTLAPLTYYFLIFSSSVVANKYQKNLSRLHNLATASSLARQSVMPLPPDIELKDGETVDTLLRSFTLSSPAATISARFLKRPFTPFVQKMVEEGIHTAVKEQQGKGDALVLLWTDKGRYSEMDLFEAIVQSGKERNLAWKLAGGQRAIEKLNAGSSAAGRGEVEDDDVETDVSWKDSARARESRFVLAFQDRHEARRFVREWHRRPCPALTKQTPPLVNAQILW
jgi:hypothetical protein